jgi:hypothetical protein
MMKKEDVKDTVECRNQIIQYVEYLEGGNEKVPEDFYLYCVHKLLTKASLFALREVLLKINKQLTADVDSKEKTLDEADDFYNKAKDKAFKHCLILEIKHNYLRKNSHSLEFA